MEKTTIYGLPLNPTHLLDELKGASFCVSYGTREKLGAQLDQAIRLVGKDGILLVDNGAFSAFQLGVNTMTDAAYLEGFAAWANDISERCPQAIVVLPDVIGGTAEDNANLALKTMPMLDACDRAMPIWHLHEPLGYLEWLLDIGFNYVGFGSSGEYFDLNNPKWAGRIQEAFDLIAAWEQATGKTRPRIHMMRAQSKAHLFAFDSSDSTNVAVNHNRQRRVSNEDIKAFAARVDNKIQRSAGPAAPHQIERPLSSLQALTDDFASDLLTRLGFEVSMVGEGDDSMEFSDEEEAEYQAMVRGIPQQQMAFGF